MKKRVFQFRILYWFSAFFFPVVALVMLSGVSSGFVSNFSWINLIYFLTTGVLAVIVCVKLFEKERNVVAWMNICIIILLLPTIYRSLISILNLNFTADHVIYAGFAAVFLILINKYRYRFENFDEINQIGHKADEK